MYPFSATAGVATTPSYSCANPPICFNQSVKVIHPLADRVLASFIDEQQERVFTIRLNKILVEGCRTLTMMCQLLL